MKETFLECQRFRVATAISQEKIARQRVYRNSDELINIDEVILANPETTTCDLVVQNLKS